VSLYPQLSNDISFWLPENIGKFSSNAFYDLVRDNGGDLIEQVELIDNFINPKTKRTSHCYRITYRSMSRTLTQKEVSDLQKVISNKVVQEYNVKIR
jgi:phenylalanyl-tRNA synthetase alpha chain